MNFCPLWRHRDRSAAAPDGSLCHLLAEDTKGRLLGAAPCYVKTHSRGEYVFDHGWAEAFERAGGDYYPKLQVAVPFTPVTGPRLLARPGPTSDAVRNGLADALAELTSSNELSSAHVTFLPEAEWRLLGRARFPAENGPAIPLGERRLPLFRRVPGRACITQTQNDPSRAQGRIESGHRSPLADRQ